MITASAEEFWNSAAEKYAASPVGDMPAFDRKKAHLRQHLSSAANVLELGCGTGSLALSMASHAGHIHALDVSAEMIRIAREKKARQGLPNVTFHCGTLEAARFPAGGFDAIWAFSILHLLDDRVGTLDRFMSLLKPGGVLIVSNVCLGDSWVPYRPMIAVMRWLGRAPKVYFYKRDTIRRELAGAGFDAIEEIDVGAKKMVAFMEARKPQARGEASPGS